MTRDQPDLFGEAQPDLFGEEPAQAYKPFTPDLDDIRARLYGLLAKARAAEDGVVPWDPKKTGLYRTVFPQMANWLPQEEADQLRFEFARELERLSRAA